VLLALLCTWLALAPGGGRLYLSWGGGAAALEFDIASGAFSPTDQRAAPNPLEATSDGVRFVADLLPEQPSTAEHVASRVSVRDSESGRLITSILLPNGSTGVRGLAISPNGKWAFATHILARYTVHTTQLEQGWINTNALSIINVPGRMLHATVLLDDVDDGAANPWAVAVSPDSRTVYVTHAGTHELSVIDLPALLARIDGHEGDPANRLSFLHGIRQRIQLPGKGPRALALAAGKIWIAEHFTQTLTSISIPGTGYAAPELETYRTGPPTLQSLEQRGEMLFNDASLCFQRWQSCASCHPDARVDGLNWDLVNDGIGNPKNTRTMVNAHRLPPVMWTGVRPDAEYAVRSGIRHIQFLEPDEEDARAIDAYLKSLQPEPGPVADARSVERGRKLFFSTETGCTACHPKPLYTDNQLHDVGTHAENDFTIESSGKRTPQTHFKTPSLLEAWRTAPYLHDGRHATILEVITKGNHANRRGKTTQLTARELEDLAAFVASL